MYNLQNTPPLPVDDQLIGQQVPPKPSFRIVEISFPIDKIYFPLKLTSVYGSTIVPATIRVMGLVSPEIPNDISSYTKVTYYSNENSYPILPASFKTNSANPAGFDYTQIQIDAPSKLLTSDLWVSNFAPLRTNLDKLVINTSFIILLKGLIISSMLSALVTSLLVFKQARSRNFWKYSLIGLANIFSLIAVIVVVSLLRTGTIKPDDQHLFDAIKAKGYNINSFKTQDRMKFLFIPIFSILFLVFLIVGGEMFKWIL